MTRGIQANYTAGPFSASLSWNDGFYSDRFNWISGELSFSLNSANTLALVGMGNLGSTRYTSPATPLYQNNSDIYNLIYTYASRPWTFQPYLQYTYVPRNTALGIAKGTATEGVAFLTGYHLTSHVTLAFRGEYISSTGNTSDGALNLIYGPGSQAWSLTVTPTYQDQDFFARAEVSFVKAIDYVPGDAFG
ncbi:hypothetical protein B1A_05582, partial [mine drainage metagenome]